MPFQIRAYNKGPNFGGIGKLGAKYMIVTRYERGETNFPLGHSGITFLKEQMYEASVVKEDVYLTSLFPNREAARSDAGFDKYLKALISEIKFVKPQRILIMGTTLAHEFCFGFSEMREDHGAFFSGLYGALRIFTVPTYEFEEFSTRRNLVETSKRDLHRFFCLPDPVEPEFSKIPSFKWLDNPIPHNATVFIDIETASKYPTKAEAPPGYVGKFFHKDDALYPDRAKITSIGVYWKERGFVLILDKPSKMDLERLYRCLQESEAKVVMHNGSFDLYHLQHQTGIFWGFPKGKYEDTMMLAHQWGEPILALKHLTSMYTDRPSSRSFGGYEDPRYLAEDVYSTAEIYEFMHSKVETIKNGWYARSLVNDLVPIFVGMRNRGVYVDRNRLREVIVEYGRLKEAKLKELQELAARARYQFERKYLTERGKGPEFDTIYAGLQEQEIIDAYVAKITSKINWNSNPQVIELFQSCGIPLTEKTPAGAFSIAEKVLDALQERYPLAAKLLEYRGIEKMMSFLVGFIEDTTDTHPYLHPRLQLAGTDTGRLSCKDPNIQQIPREGPVKTIFVPRMKGGLYAIVDLKQAELRCAAYLSGDLDFTRMLLEEDAHTAVAAAIYGIPMDKVDKATRKFVKRFIFGILYGGTIYGLAARENMNPEDIKIVEDLFIKRFPKLMQWLKTTKRNGVRDLEIVTPFGRRRDLTEVNLLEGSKGVERKAVNTPPQSMASDVVLTIFTSVFAELRERKLKSRPLFTVHDSILSEVVSEKEMQPFAEVVQNGFLSVSKTPIMKINPEVARLLPFEGDLIFGSSWATVESTNENYSPVAIFSCSSHGTLRKEDK